MKDRKRHTIAAGALICVNPRIGAQKAICCPSEGQRSYQCEDVDVPSGGGGPGIERGTLEPSG
jgi:hypothetical protein